MTVAVGVALVAAPAWADELQNRVLAAARATRAEGYVFRRTTVAEQTGSAKKVFVEQYDPRRPMADRWSLVSIDGQAPTAKQVAQARKQKRGPVPSYAELAKWFGAPATRTDTGPGTVTYRFARLPAGTMKLGSHDASADTQAEAVVNTRGATPFVERVRFTSTKGFRMMLVASVKGIAASRRFTQMPDGAVVPAETALTMTGSMMGKSGQLRTHTTFGDWQAVR